MTPAICLNNEVVELASRMQIAFERCCLLKNCDVHVRRHVEQHISDFDEGRFAVYRITVLLLASVEI